MYTLICILKLLKIISKETHHKWKWNRLYAIIIINLSLANVCLAFNILGQHFRSSASPLIYLQFCIRHGDCLGLMMFLIIFYPTERPFHCIPLRFNSEVQHFMYVCHRFRSAWTEKIYIKNIQTRIRYKRRQHCSKYWNKRKQNNNKKSQSLQPKTNTWQHAASVPFTRGFLWATVFMLIAPFNWPLVADTALWCMCPVCCNCRLSE